MKVCFVSRELWYRVWIELLTKLKWNIWRHSQRRRVHWRSVCISDSGPCWLIAVSVKILSNCFIVDERRKLLEVKDHLNCQRGCWFIAGSDSRNIINFFNCLHLPRSQASQTSVCLLPSWCGSDKLFSPLRKILSLQLVVTAWMRQEVRRTQLCQLVMVDHLGESGTRAAWNQRALPSGVVVFWGAVRRTQVTWAIHRPRLSLVLSQLRVNQSLVKVKASQLLHTQSVQRRRTLHFHWSHNYTPLRYVRNVAREE